MISYDSILMDKSGISNKYKPVDLIIFFKDFFLYQISLYH